MKMKQVIKLIHGSVENNKFEASYLYTDEDERNRSEYYIDYKQISEKEILLFDPENSNSVLIDTDNINNQDELIVAINNNLTVNIIAFDTMYNVKPENTKTTYEELVKKENRSELEKMFIRVYELEN